MKDVAKAQVLLFETPSASGRYLCTNGIYQFGGFAHRVSRLFLSLMFTGKSVFKYVHVLVFVRDRSIS